MYDDYGWKPYVSVAKRRKKAEREVAKLRKEGHATAPVVLQGRALAKTFWGKAWCDNLEAYSDYANRLPRGRTYVRNGSVVDLQVKGGEVKALVSGSAMYKVSVQVSPISQSSWRAICKDCAGSIDSLVELLQGRLSKAVMERVCQLKTGLFPVPAEIKLACSCPDWASMCKHVAAVLYGIGARLDEQPALIFKLRSVDEAELIATAAQGRTLSTKAAKTEKVLDDDLSALFGLELEQGAAVASESETSKKRPAQQRTKKLAANTSSKSGKKVAKKTVKKATAKARVNEAPPVTVKGKGRATAPGKRAKTRPNQ